MHAGSQRVSGCTKQEGIFPEVRIFKNILKGLKMSGMKPLMDGCRIPFIFKSGGDGPGLGYRVDGAVVARAFLPEFATSQVVPSYDRYLTAIYRNSTTLLLPLEVWKFSGRNRPSRIMPSNLFCGGTKE